MLNISDRPLLSGPGLGDPPTPTHLVKERLKDAVPKSPRQILNLDSDSGELSATLKHEGSVKPTVKPTSSHLYLA